MKIPSHKRTKVRSVYPLVAVLVILISRHFSGVEAILVPNYCSCIFFWPLKRNTQSYPKKVSNGKGGKKPLYVVLDCELN